RKKMVAIELANQIDKQGLRAAHGHGRDQKHHPQGTAIVEMNQWPCGKRESRLDFHGLSFEKGVICVFTSMRPWQRKTRRVVARGVSICPSGPRGFDQSESFHARQRVSSHEARARPRRQKRQPLPKFPAVAQAEQAPGSKRPGRSACRERG